MLLLLGCIRDSVQENRVDGILLLWVIYPTTLHVSSTVETLNPNENGRTSELLWCSYHYLESWIFKEQAVFMGLWESLHYFCQQQQQQQKEFGGWQRDRRKLQWKCKTRKIVFCLGKHLVCRKNSISYCEKRGAEVSGLSQSFLIRTIPYHFRLEALLSACNCARANGAEEPN